MQKTFPIVVILLKTRMLEKQKIHSIPGCKTVWGPDIGGKTVWNWYWVPEQTLCMVILTAKCFYWKKGEAKQPTNLSTQILRFLRFRKFRHFHCKRQSVSCRSQKVINCLPHERRRPKLGNFTKPKDEGHFFENILYPGPFYIPWSLYATRHFIVWIIYNLFHSGHNMLQQPPDPGWLFCLSVFNQLESFKVSQN